MKIGIDIRALGDLRTGIGHYLLMMLKTLELRDTENEYVLFYNSLKGELTGDVPEKGNFKIVRIRIPNRLLNVFWAFTQFPRVERFTGNIDVFHSPNFQMAPSRKSASVLTIHDLIFLLHPEMAIPSSLRHYKPRIKHYLKRSNIVVADSKATAADIIDYLHFPGELVEVVYPGAITMKKASRAQINELKGRHSLEENYILFVSCLEPRKNLARLFQAFDRSGLWSDFQLVLAGPKGWHFEKLQDIWNSLRCKNRIRWLNYVPDDDLSILYSGASFFVYPSIMEGFGLPILEAMSVECPVMTSNVSSMPEVAGDAALYIDPHDIDSIADGLRRLAGDSELRAKLSESGLSRTKMFTWEKMADNMIKVYKRAYEIYRS